MISAGPDDGCYITTYLLDIEILRAFGAQLILNLYFINVVKAALLGILRVLVNGGIKVPLAILLFKAGVHVWIAEVDTLLVVTLEDLVGGCW